MAEAWSTDILEAIEEYQRDKADWEYWVAPRGYFDVGDWAEYSEKECMEEYNNLFSWEIRRRSV